MGRGGDRKSKSIQEHKAAGTYRRDRHSARVEVLAQPIVGIPAPPKHFDAEHVSKWNEVWMLLDDLKIMAKQDFDSVVQYVEVTIVMRRAWEGMQIGRVVETKHGPRLNPNWRIYSDCEKILKALREKFGFTPKDRQSIKVSNIDPDQIDPIAALLNPNKN